ncbi:PepSY domain-containing protein [Micrococcus sp. HG099]|uniref:PepSY domain-containing protein n=1 Tax=Micrococcus sp. HG099 TaxID=2969755 RepID=UPI00215ADC6F|nr:PepSY domain-containing protein [Micrococcus sp. HG099]MCR8674880.1 PepSY domain-containing protein [Micrococcus sp. HG099]
MNATSIARKTALTGTGLLAALALAACGTADDDTAANPQESAVQQSPTQAATTAPAGDDNDDRDDASGSASTSPAAASGSVERQGDDPAYAAIDEILGLHGDGVIVEMDLDDDDAKWEVDVVVGDDVKEYDVTTDGQVSEGVRPQIDDDVRRAGEAQVTAETAISTALQGRTDQTVDEVDLDEEDGTLAWKVELDRENGEDGAEVKIDAKTGDVIEVEEG